MDYMDAGDYRSAVTSLLGAQKAGFKDVHFLLAECYNAMAYYVEAVEEIDKAIAAKPDESEHYHMRAAMKVNTGKFDGVEADRQKAFELIKIDNEKNRERNAQAVKDGYSSLTAQYEDIFREIDEQMKIITEKGPPAPNPGSVVMNNK
jgi:tetratricopeptide (TPR) repeat protein